MTRLNAIMAATIGALLCTNALTALGNNEAISLERDIAYADGYQTALSDIIVGACQHIPEGEDYDRCESRFEGVVTRLSELGAIVTMKE